MFEVEINIETYINIKYFVKEDLVMDKMKEILKDLMPEGIPSIMCKAPVYKVNITTDGALFNLGIAMVIADEEFKYDKSDVDEYTIISIDKRHQLDCIQIICGACSAPYAVAAGDGKNIVYGRSTINKIAFAIIGFFCKKDSVCTSDIDQLSRIVTDIIRKDIIPHYVYDSQNFKFKPGTELFTRIINLIKNIWFLPYTEIDLFKEKMINELKEEQAKHDSAE